MANIKKIKLGDVTYNLRDADAARIADAKITSESTTTVAVGGISKGTSLKDKSVAEVIESIFFPYVAFSFNSITTSADAGTKEYGTPVTISKVTPSFTAGSKAINSVKIGTTSGGDDLYSGITASTGAAITLTNSKTYDGTTGGTIYCTLSDGTTTLTKKATVDYVYYTYYAVTDTTEIPTSWTAVGGISVSDISITANAGQYIWIASTGTYTGICQFNELSGKYNTPAATIITSGQTLVNSKNYTCTNIYNFYRLESPRAANTNTKFKLGN
jgi:hypothetical protein